MDMVQLKIEKDKNIVKYISLIRRFDNSLSINMVKYSIENGDFAVGVDLKDRGLGLAEFRKQDLFRQLISDLIDMNAKIEIYYQGKLKSLEFLDNLLDELKQECYTEINISEELIIQDTLLLIQKNAIQIIREKLESKLPLGQSKIGGKPHLPEGFVWPYYEEESYDGITESHPLPFLAQINLSEVTSFDRDSLLPKTGMLYFFYKTQTMPWGFNSQDKGCARVYYYDKETSDLKEIDFPSNLGVGHIIPEQGLSFTSKVSIPSYEEFSKYIRHCEWDDYEYVKEAFGWDIDEPGQNIKLLGYAEPIQGEMLEECERVSRGIYCGNGLEEISKEQVEDIRNSSEEWTLLFQMGSIEDNEFKLMWGDCGCIYFYVKKQDLKNKDFSHVCLILQCY